MGIGLSIRRSIVEAHAGRLWAIVCGPLGALFQFTIRLLDDESVVPGFAGTAWEGLRSRGSGCWRYGRRHHVEWGKEMKRTSVVVLGTLIGFSLAAQLTNNMNRGGQVHSLISASSGMLGI